LIKAAGRGEGLAALAAKAATVFGPFRDRGLGGPGKRQARADPVCDGSTIRCLPKIKRQQPHVRPPLRPAAGF